MVVINCNVFKREEVHPGRNIVNVPDEIQPTLLALKAPVVLSVLGERRRTIDTFQRGKLKERLKQFLSIHTRVGQVVDFGVYLTADCNCLVRSKEEQGFQKPSI